MQIFIEGILVFSKYIVEILTLFISGLGLGGLTAVWLFRKRDFDERLMYVLLLGFGELGLLAVLFRLLGLLNRYVIAGVALCGAGAWILLAVRGAFSHWKRADVGRNVWIPAGFFAFSLLLRLGFVNGLTLPPYSDSALHYERVAAMLSLPGSDPFSWYSLLSYYHMGFHSITAWVDTASGNSLPLSMAVVGQFFLALLPLTVYFMLLAFTESDVPVALFGALLAGLGWLMPAHAANYGKYPEMAGVFLLPLLLGLTHLILNGKRDARPRGKSKAVAAPVVISWDWLAYLGLISISLVWLHSRILIFLGLYAAAYAAAFFFEKRFVGRGWYSVSIAGLSLLVFVWVFLLSQNETGDAYFRYYVGTFGQATFLTLALLPFAVRQFPRMVFQWMMLILFLLLGILLSLPQDFYRYPLTLIDQPFLAITFFLPLSVFGALGLSGVRGMSVEQNNFFRDMLVFLVCILLLHGATAPQPWRPMSVSNYATGDDTSSMDWIKEETEPNAIFVIASMDTTTGYLRPSDAGIWVRALTGRSIVKYPYDTQWDSEKELRAVCAETGDAQPVYVYAGNAPNSFDLPSCSMQPGLIPTNCLEKARIFALNCKAVQ